MVTYSIAGSFKRIMEYRVRVDGEEAIFKIAPIMTEEEFLTEFGATAELKADIMRSNQLVPVPWNQTYHIKADELNVIETVPITVKTHLPGLSQNLIANSSLMPILKYTQEWATLIYAIDHIFPLLDRDVISLVFPWLVDVLREENYDFTAPRKWRNGQNIRFYAKYAICGAKERAKCDQCLRIFMGRINTKNKRVPLIPTILRDAISQGNKLYTQVRLLRNCPHVQVSANKIKVVPQITDRYVPEVIKQAVEELKMFQAGQIPNAE